MENTQAVMALACFHYSCHRLLGLRHHLLYTELHHTNSNQKVVDHLVLMRMSISRFFKTRLLDWGEGSDAASFYLHSIHSQLTKDFLALAMLLISFSPPPPKACSHLLLYQLFLDFFSLIHNVPGSFPHLSAIWRAKHSLILCVSLLFHPGPTLLLLLHNGKILKQQN